MIIFFIPFVGECLFFLFWQGFSTPKSSHVTGADLFIDSTLFHRLICQDTALSPGLDCYSFRTKVWLATCPSLIVFFTRHPWPVAFPYKNIKLLAPPVWYFGWKCTIRESEETSDWPHHSVVCPSADSDLLWRVSVKRSRLPCRGAALLLLNVWAALYPLILIWMLSWMTLL